MKRVLTMLCILLGLWSFAGAEGASDEALQAMQAIHPEYEIIASDQWGTAAAAALAKGEERILCVAEKYNGQWQITIDNPSALRPGITPTILMDTDIALYWSYQEPSVDWPVTYRFSCFKRDGVWGIVSCTMAEVNGEGVICETQLCWRDDGALWKLTNRYDWNENQLSHKVSAYVPAKWLERYSTLATYDVEAVPLPRLFYTGSWLSEEYLALAAAELLPDDTFLGGSVDDEGLELLMQRPDGALVLVGVTSQGVTGDWHVVESAPLPEGTSYGFENFTDVLHIGDQLVSVQPFANGAWGVDYIWPQTTETTTVFMGQNWVAKNNLSRKYMGDHPWSDITAIDWTILPRSLQETVDCLDPDRWVVVNNPDPADRLHLREKADKSARSQGKYYNGTPVEVLERGETWTKVRILGVEGWMMTKYLAFDWDINDVEAAWPDLMVVDDRADVKVYSEARENARSWQLTQGADAVVIGVVGEEWYHVWFCERNEGGYMKQSDFWAGNG